VTPAGLLPFGVTKEIRALLPTWLAGMLVLVAARLFGDPKFYVLGLLACGFAAVALGALSMGHEYTHRTLALLLVQPSARARLLLTKLIVLLPLLLTLSAAAWVGLLNPIQHQLSVGSRWGDNWSTPVVIFLPALISLSLAPLLTMLCRSALAGMVFSVCIPPLIGFAGQLLALAMYGWPGVNTDAAERLAITVFWWGMSAVFAAAVVSNWLVFRRLEAIDGPLRDLQLPGGWRREATATVPERLHPLWLLARKELRLQQMAFVVSGLYLVGWAALSSVRYFVPEVFGPPLGALAVLYIALQALLTGSLASAEERHLGTLQWQVLLPVATWRQWAVKAGTAFTLALALGIGWTVLLSSLHPSADDIHVNPLWFGAVVVLTASVLWVSTLCASGVKALLLSLFGLPFVVLLLKWLDLGLNAALKSLGVWQWPATREALSVSLWLFVGMAAGYVALVLWFGMLNHRSVERSVVRAWPQVVWIFCYFVICLSVQWMVLTYY
jgi:hypothetical protein